MHRVTPWMVAVLLCVSIACGNARTEAAKDSARTEAGERPATAASKEPAPRPTAAPTPPAAAAPTWRITPQGVGTLALGAAVPEPASGYEAAYTTTFYADAQPLEGYAFADPPAVAYVARGPFSKWGDDHPGEEAPDAIKRQAIARTRSGALRADMIVTTDPRPKTVQGVGVGDAYAAFAAANPGATELQQFPGLWEEPSCVVSEASIWYFFDRCDARDKTKLIRIVVRTDDQGHDTPARPVKTERGRKAKLENKPRG